MKTLLGVTALLELGAGLALLVAPTLFVALLMNGGLEGAPALTVARIGGVGLLALGMACWLARNDSDSAAASGVAKAMVIYNLGAVLILGNVGMQSQAVGILLWPAVIIHAVMAAWCVLVVIRKPA